jgi:hypothetical protein
MKVKQSQEGRKAAPLEDEKTRKTFFAASRITGANALPTQKCDGYPSR